MDELIIAWGYFIGGCRLVVQKYKLYIIIRIQKLTVPQGSTGLYSIFIIFIIYIKYLNIIGDIIIEEVNLNDNHQPSFQT